MFLPLKRYAEFSGRSRRMEFWMFAVLQFLIGMVFIALFIVLGGGLMALATTTDPSGALAAGGAIIGLVILYILVSLALFLPALAVSMRRLHDSNRSGWWLWLFWGPYLLSLVTAGAESDALTGSIGLVMLAGGIVLLVFYFLDGTPGPNRFGEDPKGRETADTFA
jgi:uncharacterized membrane protein YhaH (DUF805 family)